MVVAKSQRGIKDGSKPQQNEVQWQRARAETLRTEERSVRMHKERVAECYWAHVLAIDNSQTTDGKIELASLLILSPGNLAMLPHNFASEPYAVARSCVFAHYAVAEDKANPFMG